MDKSAAVVSPNIYLNDGRGGPSLSVRPISASRLLLSCAARSCGEGPGFEASSSCSASDGFSELRWPVSILITFFRLAE